MELPKISSPEFSLQDLKTCSTAELQNHEVTERNNKLTVKNSVRDGNITTSDAETFLLLVKGSLGSGMLAMPYAFSNVGLLMGPLLTAFVALICAHCTHIVVKSSQELCFSQGRRSLNYTETAEFAFKYGAGRKFSKYSGHVRFIANFSMGVTYYGVNTVYVVLIAATLKQMVESHVDMDMSIRWYTLLLLPVLLPVGLVRHMKFLVPFSTLANMFLLVGCSLTVYICITDLPPLSSRPLIVDVSRWPLFFATALFAMEGIGAVMPVENAMRNPAHFLGCPGVLNLSMAVITAMYLVMGLVGYLKFGDDVEGSITLNLPEDALSETVKSLVGVAILFTYPLVLTASLEVVWNGVQHRFAADRQTSGYYLVRSLMIIGTVILAAVLPNLSPVISLVGAVGLSALGLLIPAVTELVTYWDSIRRPCGITVVKTVVLVVMWVFATISGTVTSVQEIVEEYEA